MRCGDAVRPSVCVFILQVCPCVDNPVCDLVACGVAQVSFGGSSQVYCAKLEPGLKGPKSNLHQHCEWTGGKRAPEGCPQKIGFGAYRRLEAVGRHRNDERRKRQPFKLKKGELGHRFVQKCAVKEPGRRLHDGYAQRLGTS